MRTKSKLIFIIVILAILLTLCGFLFYKLNWQEKLMQAYFAMTRKSQTLGVVTVDRGSDQIKITEINDSFWDTETISPVFGKAYKIDRLKDDGRPVHVEFAYDPKEVPTQISPSDLHLFRWHDEDGKKYWAMLPSQVDEKRHIVSADLSSFSILAIKAPVTSYLTNGEINAINQKLEEMQKNPPAFTCGLLMIMEEELITDEIHYSRMGDEDIIEMHDCRNNGSVEIADAFFNINQEKDGKSVVYVAAATVEWQRDLAESITIEGWVRDQNGEPAQNAKVIAQKTKYDGWTQKTTTDESGHYALKVHSGEYLLRAISKDASCSEATSQDEYCYRGNLWDEPTTQERWQKDLTLKCTDFIIQAVEPVELFSPSLEEGANYFLEGKSTEYSIASQHLTKVKNGYGWEGDWKMDSNVKDEIKLKDNFVTAAGGYIRTTDMYARYGGIYSFAFTVPPKPKIGSSINLSGTLSSGGYFETNIAAGTFVVGGGGQEITLNHPGAVYQDEPFEAMNLQCRFTQADEAGATLQCDPEQEFLEKDGVVLEIKRK